MRQHIELYLRNCHSCQQAKAVQHSPLGNLKPLPAPQQPWQEVSIDFVNGLPVSEGFNIIMVIVDRLTKMRDLVPCHKTTNALARAQLYLDHMWKHHSLPDALVLDRGP